MMPDNLLPAEVARDRYVCRWCGKYAYPNRRRAKIAARAINPGERTTAYRCDRTPPGVTPGWHYGHADLNARRIDRLNERIDHT